MIERFLQTIVHPCRQPLSLFDYGIHAAIIAAVALTAYFWGH